MADEFPYQLLMEGQWDPKIPKLQNKLTIYFQSKKSDGGDCVVTLEESDPRRGIIRFKNDQARQRVLLKQSHELQVGQQTLKLTVTLPPPELSNPESTSPVNKHTTGELKCVAEEKTESTEETEDTTCRPAVIENIQNITQEILVILVENILKETDVPNDFNIEVIPENNCAVVTFPSNKDTESFIRSSSSNAVIMKNNMNVRLLEMTSKVKAEGLPPNINSDLLLMYFDKFGEVEDDVVLFKNEQSAIITFQDPKDVDAIIKKQHNIKMEPIRVLPYYDSLQTALYGKNRPPLSLPEGLTENIDQNIWHHLNMNQKSLDLITQDMSTSFCKLDFQSPAVSITPLPSLIQQGGQTRKLIQTWREKTSSVFLMSMSMFRSFELVIQKDAWSEIEPEIQQAVTAIPVTLISKVDKGTVAVAGLKEDVTSIEKIVEQIVERVTQRIQRQKGSKSDKIPLSPSIYNLIFCDGSNPFHKEFPELEIKYHKNTKKLSLYGLKMEVLETKNRILQDQISLIHKPVEVHQSVLHFLNHRDLDEMATTLFLTKGINVALEVEGDRAFLIGKTEMVLKDGEKQLQTELGHLSFDVEDVGVLRRSNWQQLVSNIKNTESRVSIQMTDNQVLVSGFVQCVRTVEKQLRDFVYENSHIEKSLKAHKTIITFIKDHQTQVWFEEVNGKIVVQFNDEIILISGQRVYVSQYVPMFKKLLVSSHHCIIKIAKPGAKKFFKDKESIYVPLAKTKFGCLVQLIDEYDHDPAKSVVKAVYQCKTPDDVEITVNKADMCSFPVDAVVSGTNKGLILDGGLAKALSNADANLQTTCKQLAKKRTLTISDAVVLDAGGGLRCKHVIFALAPHYKDRDSVALLKKTIKKSLNLADRENCQSVAIPAIGSGALKFPQNLCADTIVTAIKEFYHILGGDSVLKRIHLVDTDDNTVQAFKAAVQKVYGVSSSNQKQAQNIAGSSQSQAPPPQGILQRAQTKEGLTITLMKGNIEDTTMDVVVNTLSSDLDLRVGAVSKALLNAAGPQLQVLVKQQATAPVNNGAVIVTAGANLKNKLVFHAVVPQWNQGKDNEQKVLENIIDKCLDEAEQRQQKSIVFSAIGTGNLSFPKPLVICLMLESVIKFSCERRSNNVQEVVFALHPSDAQTIQVFTHEFNKKLLTQSASANISTQQQSPGSFSKVTTTSGVHETIVGGVTLQVVSGDITSEKTDVIVNASGKDFTLKAGVSKAILNTAGPNVEAECKQLGSQPNKGLIMTEAGNLHCKKIIHVEAKNCLVSVQTMVKMALEKCAKENFTSISFPAIGTGQGELLPGQVADAMMDAVVDVVEQTPKSSLKLIRIVIFQAPMLNDFYKSMQNREPQITSYSKLKTTGQWEEEIRKSCGKDFVTKSIEGDPACFSICGSTQAAMDETKTFLGDMISKDQALQRITDTVILCFSKKDQQRIQDLQTSLDVSIKLEYKAHKDSEGEATLIVEGLAQDVLKATQEIQDMVRRAKEEEILIKNMEYASKHAEWQYEQGGQYISFDQRTNLELENSFASEATDVRITFQGQNYQIKLPEGPAVSIGSGEQMKIRRINKLKVTESLPPHWDAMAPSELLKIVTLQPTSAEYNNVLKHFKATCPNNKVVKIERIQNPGMWINYQNNKNVMEIKNKHKNNEKKLFHGTSENTINHINMRGFNRGYAGKNAAVYGNGTYFALNASYSSQNLYSVPDGQGHRHIYLCHVLTGDYTTGKSGIIVPPPKKTSFDLYDTVVDDPRAPTIFVVFRDDNAYPEYLITFT